MHDVTLEQSLYVVLMTKLIKHGLPRALKLRRKLLKGDLITDFDMRFLDDMLITIGQVKPLVGEHSEYQATIMKLTALIYEITDKALENEKNK